MDINFNFSNQDIVEEKVIGDTGDVVIHKYGKGKLLNEKGFAKYYEFVDLESNNILTAKVVAKSSLVKPKDKQKLISEINIHKSLNHASVIAFEHHFEDSKNVYILLEMCQNQSLNELLKIRKRLTEIEVQCYALQLIKGLKYLHFRKIIHRDLKLSNLLLSDKMELKISDFSLASKIEFDGQKKRTVCGTLNCIAPEILDGKQGYSYEVDIWNFGVILYTLLIGKSPFETHDIKAAYKKIKMNAYSFPETVQISEAAKNLISAILVAEPSKRPSLDAILSHDFFSQRSSIPECLPSSTLACPPSLSNIAQYKPDTESSGLVTRPYASIQSQSVANKTKKKLTSVVPGTVLESLTVTPDVWVQKWTEYASKYGLAYLLSDSSIGVFFDDSSKIILRAGTKSSITLSQNRLKVKKYYIRTS